LRVAVYAYVRASARYRQGPNKVSSYMEIKDSCGDNETALKIDFFKVVFY